MNALSFKQFLLYSPYSRVYSYPNTIKDGDEYFKRIRIIPKEFREEGEKLKKVISSSGNLERFYILSGYSGNGKTSFLHWFKEEIEKDNYYFEIINLINRGYGVENNEHLMCRCIINMLVKDFANKKVIELICEHNSIFLEIFTKKEQMQSFRAIKGNKTFDKEDAILFFNDQKFDFKQLFILFLLQRILYFQSDPNLMHKETYTFCFDNLDELELEYLTPDMWKTILQVSQLMPEIIRETNLGFEFVRRIKFVLVFREANIAVSSAQLSDNLIPLIETNRRFIFMPSIGKDIIRKRIEIYKKDSCSNDDLFIINTLEKIIEEKIIDSIILPLFNYDYRLFMEATLHIIQKQYINLTNINFNKINTDFKYVVRGILINAYIKYMAENNYLERLAPVRTPLSREQCYCNPTRLILTVFSNLSYETLKDWETEKEMHEAKPNEFSLIKAFDACRGIFSATEFLDKVKNLIDINKSSWAHLITIYGKEPHKDGESNIFDFSDIADILEEYQNDTNRYREKGKYKVLHKISFSLNASAYIYLRHLLTHFEYISAYKTRKSNISWCDMKPLFQLTNLDIQQNKEIKWAFQSCIDEVFKHVETYCANIEKYYEEKFFATGLFKNKSDFIKSRFVFKGDNNENINGETKGHLYMTRLITSHIEYIDNFRRYIIGFGYEVIKQNIDSIASDIRNNILVTKEELNSYILNIIDKYLIELEKLQDPTQINIVKILKRKVEEARCDYNTIVVVNR